MISATLIAEINQLTTADLIRLHIFINDKYAELKISVSNFASARWSVLNPDAARLNNRNQYQRTKAKRAALSHAKATVQGSLNRIQADECRE